VVIGLAVLFVVSNLLQTQGGTIECEDGVRHRMDMRNFANEFWVYSTTLEVTLGENQLIKVNLDPKVIQQLSESMQQAKEFRKWLAASFNACGITKKQNQSYGIKYHTLDNLSNQINDLLNRDKLSEVEGGNLDRLIQEYLNISRNLTKDP